jgi:hypothetical protein
VASGGKISEAAQSGEDARVAADARGIFAEGDVAGVVLFVFEAQPLILGALLEAAAHGLRTLPGVRLERLPRMADFALWSTACETAFWPVGTFWRAYDANRRAAIESVVEADVVAARVREIMAQLQHNMWVTNARMAALSIITGGGKWVPH